MLMEDLEEMEKCLCAMADLPDIWQNRIIRTLCEVTYNQLMREVKRERQSLHEELPR